MWLYDELRRMHGFEPALVAQYASLATYSRSDAEQAHCHWNTDGTRPARI